MGCAPPILLFFEPAPTPAHRPQRHTADDIARTPKLLCAACRHVITHPDARIAVAGAHEHACTNPLGLTFRIGCFRTAPGCFAEGEAIAEHSWFPGYVWRIAHCGHCRAHLGWHFASATDDFFGLILDCLAG